MLAPVDPLFDPAVVEDPHGYYAQLRALDPVHELPGTGTFLVTRMALIQEVVAKTTVFSSQSGQFLHHRANGGAPGLRGPGPTELGYGGGPGAGDGDGSGGGGAVLATADPPAHTRQRKVVARRLSTTAMHAMEPEFRELVDRNLETALATGRMEWMGQLAEPLPMIMVARILGLPDEAAPD